MSEMPPQIFVWTEDEVLCPVNKTLAAEHFCVGARYTMVELQSRSQKSHNHYFATLHEIWQNLPEHLAEKFPTSESLRKYLLIKTGWADSTSIVCASKAEAQRVASFIRPIDEFSIVTASEATVTRWTAKSQSLKAMGKEAFQKSKDDVISAGSAMIGVKNHEAERNSMEVA